MAGRNTAYETNKKTGPSGFVEINGQMLVVDHGKIYQEANSVGFLYDDGMMQDISGPLGSAEGLKPIDEIQGCIFRGIDQHGMQLELPGIVNGPTGSLNYNGVMLNVFNGRVSDQSHSLVGDLDDSGILHVRDAVSKAPRRKMEENTQLATQFQGKKSNGEDWEYSFDRPLYRKNKKYSENEIIRYFEEYDRLSTAQKNFVIFSLDMWARAGLLQLVRKSEGTAALGNVKHGASGVTGVRTGNVTLDKEEFEKEILLMNRFGTLAIVGTHYKPYVEVRLNLVVAHEYGHQLEFILSQATQERIHDIYDKKVKLAETSYKPPKGYDGPSEYLAPQHVQERVFISGYARQSMHEYWAEAAAAFSVKEGRDALRQVDPEIHELLRELVLSPEKMVRPVFVDTILDLQSSLRLGGELDENILEG